MKEGRALVFQSLVENSKLIFINVLFIAIAESNGFTLLLDKT